MDEVTYLKIYKLDDDVDFTFRVGNYTEYYSPRQLKQWTDDDSRALLRWCEQAWWHPLNVSRTTQEVLRVYINYIEEQE